MKHKTQIAIKNEQNKKAKKVNLIIGTTLIAFCLVLNHLSNVVLIG